MLSHFFSFIFRLSQSVVLANSLLTIFFGVGVLVAATNAAALVLGMLDLTGYSSEQ